MTESGSDRTPPVAEKISASDHAHPAYRADIDGLRAVAVLAVVAFHAFPNWIKGGFVGVDVFFVISGFLISTIILKNLERDTFSLLDFYGRRVRRIFPALLVVLVSSFVVGWLFLLPEEFMQLGKHIAAGAGFVSNIVLWRESGYFDTASDSKPLLHLWSLGIEEQFYIFWPLLLWAAWKMQARASLVILAIAVLSFLLNVGGVLRDQTAAFYSPQTRFWELLVGAMLAWIFSHRPNSNSSAQLNGLLAPIGALFLATGFVLISGKSDFPGWWALLPTIGTAMTIAAGPNALINRIVFSNRLMVGIGLISYPIYLWHWPLLSFAKILNGAEDDELPVGLRIGMVLASLGLAWLTYRIVETPVRRFKGRFQLAVPLFLFMCVVGGGGLAVLLLDGVETRACAQKAAKFQMSILATQKREECFEIPYAYSKSGEWFCSLGPTDRAPQLFVYGDSHALSLIPAIEKFANEKRVHALFSGSSGCPPLLGVQSLRGEALREKFNCKVLNDRIFTYVKANRMKAVLLVGRWSYYTGGTTRPDELNLISTGEFATETRETSRISFERGLAITIEAYSKIGVHVFLVEDNPQQTVGPQKAMRKARELSEQAINRLAVSWEEHVLNNEFPNSLIRKLNDPRAHVVSFDRDLCIDVACPLVAKDRFLYVDADHLSVAGAELVYPTLERSFQTISW